MFGSTGMDRILLRPRSPTAGRRRGKGVVAALLLLGASAAAAQSAGDAVAPPRPLSPAERAAVAFAVDYFSRGAVAWVPSLSETGRFAGLPPADAEAEIEARVGPTDGARWELRTIGPDSKDTSAIFSVDYPSGVDTAFVLRVAWNGDTWRIVDVRSLDEPESRLASAEPGPPASAKPPSAESPPLSSSRGLAAPAVFLALSVVLLGLSIAYSRRRRMFPFLVGGSVAAAAAAGGLTFLAGTPTAPPPPPEPVRKQAAESSGAGARLGPLRELRRSIATSTSVGIDQILQTPAPDPAAARVARVWAVQCSLRDRDLKGAGRILREIPQDARIPQAEILRARLAFLENRSADVARAYAAAVSRSPDHDGLLFEAGQVLRLISEEGSADAYILEAAHKGSRMAEVHYTQAAYWVRQEKGVEAEKWFRQGWSLRPVERTALLGQSFFWDLLRRPGLYAALQLDSSSEPAVAAPDVSQSPLALPVGGEARLCGAYLRLRLGTGEIHVPGGAVLAPRGTTADDAGGWTRDEEKAALADLPRLTGLTRSGSVLLQPLLRRRVEAALSTLARRHRWEEIVALTDGIEQTIERVPTEFVLSRAEGLRRTDRSAASRELVTRAAQAPIFLRRASASELFDLAALFCAFGDYDRGIELAEKARGKVRLPIGDAFLQRLKMERRLAASYATRNTEHFVIRFPREHPESGTRKLGAVLEGERARLTKWIPLRSFGKTEVQLLWFDEFQKTFSGSVAIAGLFDGKIRLPFAGGESLDFSHPEIVAIVTHELAHAMISELTLDSTPHWFQEGLAQHVEMRQEHFNPVPLQETQHRILSLPVVEGVLEGLPAPDLAEASYEEAVWMVHYIEATYGVKGIARMLEAFRAGSDTEDAFRKLQMSSIPEFENRFRVWSRLPAARSWKTAMKRYLGNEATDPTMPASFDKSSHRIRWNQSEEVFPPETTPRR